MLQSCNVWLPVTQWQNNHFKIGRIRAIENVRMVFVPQDIGVHDFGNNIKQLRALEINLAMFSSNVKRGNL